MARPRRRSAATGAPSRPQAPHSAVGELVRDGRGAQTPAGPVPLVDPVAAPEDRERGDARLAGREPARAHAVDDDVGEERAQPPPARAEARELAGWQRAPLAEVEADGVVVGKDGARVRADHLPEPGFRRRFARDDRLELADGVLEQALEQPREQLVLRADVVIE